MDALNPVGRVSQSGPIPRQAAGQLPTLEQSLATWVEAAPLDERPARLEVQGRILEWNRENGGLPSAYTAALDLSRMRLTELPTAIGMLQNLTQLDLNGNLLAELPREVGQLRNLMQLDVSSNALTRLPAEIGNLVNLVSLLADANPLTALPSTIGQMSNLQGLSLFGCHLTQLPDEIGDLQNLHDIDLRSNTLQQLPDSIRYLMPTCNVRITEVNFPDAIVAQLRLSNEAHRNIGQARSTAVPPDQTDARFIVSDEQRAELSTDHSGHIEHAASFFDWLDRMQATRDYRNPATRQPLELALTQLIDEMRADVALRKSCFAIAADALTACNDRVAVAFNSMHEAALIARTLRPGTDEKSLVGTGIDLFALQLVNAHARNAITELGRGVNAADIWQEDVATLLFFQSALRAELAPDGIHVPVQTQEMINPTASGASRRDIEAAATAIRTELRDGESLMAHMLTWPPITQMVKRDHAHLFLAIEEQARNELKDLKKQAKSGAIPESEYLANARSLMQKIATQQAALTARLAFDILENYIPLSPQAASQCVADVIGRAAATLAHVPVSFDLSVPDVAQWRRDSRALFEVGRYAQAEVLARSVIAADPNPQNHLLLAQILLEMGRPAEALEILHGVQEAVSANPMLPLIFARAHLLLDQPEIANQHLRSAARPIPTLSALTEAMVEHSLSHTVEAKRALELGIAEMERNKMPFGAEVAQACAWLGLERSAMTWLAQSARTGGGNGIVRVLLSPMTGPLHEKTHWQQMHTGVTQLLA